jgi:transposase
MIVTEELGKLRVESGWLRKQLATKTNAWQKQKQKSNNLEEKLEQSESAKRALEDEVQRLKNANKDLEDKLAALTEVKDKYQGMIFKAAVKTTGLNSGTGKKRGAQVGHKGRSRKKPLEIDLEKDIYLSHCPDCHSPVTQTNTVYERTVIDIPIPKAVTTKYTIQRQWCGNCSKEVCGVPEGTLPGLRFGTNFLGWLLLQKYRIRTPLNKLVELALAAYRLKVTEGGLQKLLSKLKKQLGSNYAEILKEIRKAKVKHADETSWRIAGQNGWCWLFATQKAAYYTIEETRGHGVPKKVLEGSPLDSILVRDDYPGYNCINAHHQSCWSHLLRVSHELAALPNASKEMKKLHKELSQMFQELETITKSSFDQKLRQAAYAEYTTKLETIGARNYRHKDSNKVQTRIKNQHTNLLTAILYRNVPLTNNHAERQIRPMAVTRKISGGSQSSRGASIHAVLMSVVQTMNLRGQNILDTLPKLLTLPVHGYTLALEKGE